MKIYNTLTRTVEEFIPYEEGKVKFYTCGPTVYHYAHIGNMRNYIGHDILDKTLRYLGYDVKRVMNITDVGHLKSDSDSGADKMVESAKAEHKSVMDIAKFYTDKFFDDCDKLNIKKPELVCPATENIDEYIKKLDLIVENEKNNEYVIKISNENKAHQLLKDLINANIEVNKFEINKPTLNDIFIEKVGE